MYPNEKPKAPASGEGNTEFDRIFALHKRAVKTKQPWLGLFQECFDYTMPLRESPFGETPGDEGMEHIFDETGMVGVDEFVSRLKDGILPAYSKFAILEGGSEISDEDRESVDRALEPITDYVFQTIQESNFDTEVIESLLDMTVSVGNIAVYESDPRDVKPFYCKALPMAHMNLLDGPFGKIGFWSKQRKILIKDIEVAYPGASLDSELREKLRDDPLAEVVLFEAIEQDYKAENETYTWYLCYEKGKHVLDKQEYEGIGSNPWISFRWHKLAGETWGRGPVIKALPSIRTANLTVQMVLENAEINMAGIYTAEDDGVINPENIRLVPGTIIPVAAGSQGLKAINGAGSFDVSQLILDELRQNIRKALYNEMLGAPTGTPMSAREVSERMQELYRVAGPNFIRLISELVDPFIKRVIFILKKRGLIELPSVNGREVSVRPTSPMSRAQDNEDVVNFAQFADLAAGAFGPQAMMMKIDQNKAMDGLAQRLGVPASWLRDEANQQEIMNQLGQLIGGTNGQSTEEEGGTPPQNVTPFPGTG